jgi:AraC family transcriptional regulator of adaptative response / DNA-3-methyladenine glycosylase II
MSENRYRNTGPDVRMPSMDPLDPHTCYRALQTRDARFDGRFFIGVSTTGIYCRPICPARTACFDNCSFFPSAAAAQSCGFRPCLRCRPETAPGRGAWLGTFNTVSRALRLIEDGALDDDAATVDALAARLGVGERHLRRLFQVHLGASPVAVAQTRRVLFAKQLLQDTSLPMADVAMASGFGSVRRFNEVFQSLYQQAPSQLRTARLRAREPDGIENLRGLSVQVPYREPYDASALLRFLATRAIEGVEHVAGDTYQRTLWQDGAAGVVSVLAVRGKALLKVTVQHPSIRPLPAILARVRRVFDVDADIERIHAHLSQDPFMAGLVQARPGLRAPGGWDGFELAVRAVLGQQVTVVAARRLAARLVQICGARVALQTGALSHCFPTAEQVLAADLSSLGMPGARKNALKALALATLADRDLFCVSERIDDTVKRLCAIPGIGEWTAHYIALRAVRETDAFPASDVGLLRSMAVNGERPSPAQLLSRAEAWRPWRAYAAQHLWAADPDFLDT